MKKSSKQVPANRRRRLMILSAVAVVVMVAAVTVISRQKARTAAAADNRVAEKPAAQATRNFVTRRVGNQDILIDPQTGDVKPLTAEEAQKLANGLAPMLDTSTDGLVQVKHADGSVSMDLQGRFQNVTVARVTADGGIEQSCVDDPRAAAKFFRIDPKLIENAPTARRRVNRN